jgi:transposase-like protein
MGKRGHSEKQILRVLREAESGDTVVELCRKHEISQQIRLWSTTSQRHVAPALERSPCGIGLCGSGEAIRCRRW